MFSIKSVEFHGFEIPGILRNLAEFRQFCNAQHPPKLGLPGENAQLGAPSNIGKIVRVLWSLSGRIYLGKKQQLKQPVVWAEYDLAVRFPIIFSVVSVSALLALLHALRRAAEGYDAFQLRLGEWRTLWIADAHRGDEKRFVVHADEKWTVLMEPNRQFAVRKRACESARELKRACFMMHKSFCSSPSVPGYYEPTCGAYAVQFI